MKKTLVLIGLMVFVPGKKNVYGQFATRLLPPTETSSILYGDAVAYDPIDHWVMVSRQNEWVTVGEQVGAVYLYHYENSAWEYKARLVADSLKTHMSFGFAIAALGDLLLVGSSEGMHIFRKDQNDLWNSEAHIKVEQAARNRSYRPFDFISENLVVFRNSIYEYSIGSWNAIQSLRPEGVNISATANFIWAQDGYGQDIKQIVYERDGNTWNEIMEIASFGGYDLALNDDWAAFHYVENGAARIRIYQFNNEEWQFHSDIIHPDRTYFFASNISLDGNRMLVADWNYDTKLLGLNTVGGIVYLYEYSERNNQWDLIDENRGVEDEELFGTSVVMTDQGMVVGTSEAVHILEPPPLPTNSEDSEPEQATSLSIYPNPATTDLRIEFGDQVGGRAELVLYDLQGRQIKRIFYSYLEGGPSQSVKVDTRDLPSGAYILKADLPSHSTSRLFLKN